MLKGAKPLGGWFALALAAFVLFWSLALSGSLPIPQPNQQIETSSTECTTHECRADAAAASLTFYTELLAWFTCILAIASIAQGIFLIRADRTARIAANAAKEIGEKQLALAGLHADIAEKQKEIDRLKFFAEFRPQIEIRFVKKLRERDDVPPDQQATRVEFVVVNSGTGEAVVLGSKVTLEWLYSEDIPVPTDLEGEDLIPKHRYLQGATDKTIVESDQDGGLNEFCGDGSKKLYLLGWVAYADGRGAEFGSTRTTYFLREYNTALKLFMDPSGTIGIDPDWNTIQ